MEDIEEQERFANWKLANLLVCPEGSMKLLDFGVARILSELPGVLVGDLPKVSDLKAIFAKASEKNPELRYGIVFEWAEDLRRYLAGEPVLASPTAVLVDSQSASSGSGPTPPGIFISQWENS